MADKLIAKVQEAREVWSKTDSEMHSAKESYNKKVLESYEKLKEFSILTERLAVLLINSVQSGQTNQTATEPESTTDTVEKVKREDNVVGEPVKPEEPVVKVEEPDKVEEPKTSPSGFQSRLNRKRDW